jgi:DNA-binding XRE family transcriptional regulator
VVVVNAVVPGSSTGALVAMITGLTSQTVNSSVDTNRYTVAWRLTRRITKRFNVSTRYTYVKQQSAPNSNAVTSDFDDHLVTLNFQYDFDRWNMW